MTSASRLAIVATIAVVAVVVLAVALYLWGLSEAAAVTGTAALALGTAGGGAYRSAQRTETVRRERETVEEIEEADAGLAERRAEALLRGTPRERNNAHIAEARRRRGES